MLRRNRNAATRRKKALLMGINYSHAPDLQLRFPQRDMRKMYALLKDNFEFQDEDIITLTDEAGSSLAPTQENIMQAVHEFIIRGQDNTDYVFFYSGHAGQHEESESDESVEEDGMKEFIVPVDTEKDVTGDFTPDSVIYDTYLHEEIIKPLNKTKGCHLFTMFDCCHSATLLNLGHCRCNRIGKFTSLVRRVIRRYVVEDTALYNMFQNTTTSRKCNGLCPRVPNRSGNSTVICISACKDSQIAFEHEKSDTFASAIVNLLQAKPKATIKDVMYAVKYAADRMHRAARDECWGRWKYISFLNLFKSPASVAEHAQARCYPQLSSHDPLDTNTTLMYSDIRTLKLDGRGRVKRSTLETFQHFAPTLSLSRWASSRRTG